ncbi:neural cell adhesion molecule 1-like [Littorina saxatilis]|uniref:neural cell adhesion molecule 1-like n=1 Tax=Littorina saxatilis TaxID=31220 RepID=UPI0038B60822
MIKMKLFAVYVFMACSGVVSSQEQDNKTVVRLEPDYNPLWIQMGRKFSATCIAESDKDKTVTWTINGAEPKAWGFTVKNSSATLPDGRVRTSSLLTKDTIGFEDFNLEGLLCETEDRVEKYVAVHLFNVQTEHPNITEGEDISLKCAPDQPARVVWSHDDHVISSATERRVLTENNTTLVIQNSRPQDSGLYKCTVLIEAGYDMTMKTPKEQAFVQNIPVSAKPYLLKKVTTRVETLINDTLSLVCPVAAYPPPEVYWLRDDDSPVPRSARNLFAESHGLQDATLTVIDVTKTDLGVYVCVAENSVGKMVKEFHVGLVGGASFGHAHAGLWSVLIGFCVSVLFSM